MNNNTEISKTKVCSKCKVEKITTDCFSKNKNSRDGYQTICKTCTNEYSKNHYRKNKDKYYLKNKKWQENNRDRYNELKRNHYKKNKRDSLTRSKRFFDENPNYREKYYLSNKNKLNGINRKWYKENKHKHRLMMKKWTENNKEKRNLYTIKYQHRKKTLICDLTDDEWRQSIAFFGYSCAYCGVNNKKITKDHFIPVSKGGGLTRINILPACSSCNSSKHNKDFLKWYRNSEVYSKSREQKIQLYIKKQLEQSQKRI